MSRSSVRFRSQAPLLDLRPSRPISSPRDKGPGVETVATWDDEAVRFHLPAAWVLACVLHIACAVLVAALAPWAGTTDNLGGVLLVAAVTAVDGVVIGLLPWHRWR